MRQGSDTTTSDEDGFDNIPDWHDSMSDRLGAGHEEISISVISSPEHRPSAQATQEERVPSLASRSSSRNSNKKTLSKRVEGLFSHLSASLIRIPSRQRRRRSRREDGEGSVCSSRSTSSPPLVVTMTDGIATIQTKEEAAARKRRNLRLYAYSSS